MLDRGTRLLDYDGLHRRLRQPEPTLVPLDDDWFTPHEPGEPGDAEQPSHGSTSRIESPHGRFLANLIAAELASYWWRERVDLPRAMRQQLADYLANVRHWLNGDVPLADVARPRGWILSPYDNPYRIADGIELQLPRHATEALQYIEVLFSSWALDHVLYSELPPFPAPRTELFVDRWWRRVRCALAVADARTLRLATIDGVDLVGHLDPDHEWFHFALTLLAWSPVAEAFQPVLELLSRRLAPMEFAHDQPRRLCIRLLGRLGNPAAIPLLRRSLERPLPFVDVPADDFNWPNQLVVGEAEEAARALGQLQTHPEAREALEMAAARSPVAGVRDTATRELAPTPPRQPDGQSPAIGSDT